jgi:membrane carboxypeptidase/penicillin-binding protein
MKLTEVIQPSAKAIFESIKEENNHSFNEGTLQAISESVANAKFTGKAMTTMEEVDAWIASL